MRIAIVDDDPKCVQECLGYIEKYNQEKKTDLQAEVFYDGFDFIEKYDSKFDIIILDIEMPKMNGLEAAHRLREKDSVVAIIFMTNMAQYAIKGYEVNAIDYVVKPVPYFTFSTKLDKAIQYYQKHVDYDFTISTKDGLKRIQISSVYYIEVLNHSLSIHTTNGTIEVTGSLSKMEDQLKQYDFSRCNNCYLINLRHITSIKDDLVYLGETALTISRAKKKAFLNDLLNYRGAIR